MEKILLNCSEVRERVIKYLDLGFKLDFVGPPLSYKLVIKTPSGRKLSVSAIEKELQGLEFGNLNQIESLKALDFYHLCGQYRRHVNEAVRLNSIL